MPRLQPRMITKAPESVPICKDNNHYPNKEVTSHMKKLKKVSTLFLIGMTEQLSGKVR